MQRSREFGDRPALIDGPTGRVLKYSEIEPSIRRVAANLAARGLQHNDVIGILSPNSIEYPLALHAAASLGAKVTTLNPLYTPLEVAQQLRDSGASQLIVGNSTTLLETARAAIAEGAVAADVHLPQVGEAAAAHALRDGPHARRRQLVAV